MTASPIASVRVFETVRVTQMSSRYVRYARNAVGARSRDHRAERSSVLGICFWPFIVRQHAPIVHPLLARPRPTPQPLPRERFRSMALFGPGAIADLRPECASKRTSPSVWTVPGGERSALSEDPFAAHEGPW